MSKASTQTQAVPASASATAGLLLRKCECGNHTVAGGQCSECGKEKNKWQSPDNQSSFGIDFSVPRTSLQRKLIVGPDDDPLEREADRIADHVTAPGPASATAPRIQRYSTQTTGRSEAALASVGNALAGPGYQLDPSLRRDMETRFGYDFSRVRVHSGAAAEQSAREVSARAYTVEDHIVFGSGQLAPHSQEGRRLIAHELTHVVQQSTRDRADGHQAGGTNAPFRGPQLQHVDTFGAASFQTGPFPTTVSLQTNRIFRAVTPTPVARLDRPAIFGDGTAAKPGITLGTFQSYISNQADWFVEPTLTQADRDALWKVVFLLQEGEHISTALGNLKVAELVAATPDQMKFVRDYADGADTLADMVRITNPDSNIARVIKLGEAMRELATFVPGPVLRVCINQTGLETLVDETLIPVLKDYYKQFEPTIETPKEQDPLLTLLRGGLAAFAFLTDWVRDLHIFTPPTRVRLEANVKDKTRKKPVMLVLMSGLDWNAAFLQSSTLEAAVLNPKNLALVFQGAKKISDETAKVNEVADDYGQIPKGAKKGRLGQVVFAGHGSASAVEQATPGTGVVNNDGRNVHYNQDKLSPKAPGDDSEKLIDAVLQRMNPADARVVFAGCLVGSHDVPETAALKNTKTAAAEINASLTANPNLRDLVNQRMTALKVKGTVEAANASTTFSAFRIDPVTGKAGLSLTWDPDVGGSKKAYVKTGAEPEGALRAALETWADPKLGPAWTTKTMRDHVTATLASKEWWVSLTRTAFELALPKAGDVDPAVIDNLAHRVEPWLLAGWADTANAAKLAPAVTATEAPKVYPVMLASNRKTLAHLPIVVQQAWMTVDATHEASFMAAIDASTLKRQEIFKLLKDTVVNPKLASLLKTADPAKPTRAQLRLAIVIAAEDGINMHAEVKKLLSNAAGNVRSTSFPAALGVPALLDGAKEIVLLQNIGLAPGATVAPTAMTGDDAANVDLDKDKTNETFVTISPRKLILDVAVYVRSRPNRGPWSKVLTHLSTGMEIRIVGTNTTGWTMIDLNGKVGFISKVFK